MNARWTHVLRPAVIAAVTGLVVSGSMAALVTTPASARTPSASAAPGAGAFSALTSVRLLDTRAGTGAAAVPVAAHHSIALDVLGRGGVPTSGVAAVLLNVTVAAPKKTGTVTVYPAGTTPPLTSNVNFVAGQTVADLTVAKLGRDGGVELANNSAGTVELIADVSGYYTARAVSATAAFTALDPYRAMDTRSGTGVARGSVAPGAAIALTVAGGGPGRVPTAGASAVAMTVTVVSPSAAGNVSVFPAGSKKPASSEVKFSAHQTIPNLMLVGIGDGGQVWFTNNSTGTIDLVADVAGYVLSGAPIAAGTFGPVENTGLVLDTRTNWGANARVGAHVTVHIDVTGRGSIVPAANLSAVAINLTVTRASRAGYLTAYADGTRQPATSNVNFAVSRSIENLAVVKVGANGDLALTNNSDGPVDLIAAITGFYLNASLPLPATSPGYYVRSLNGDAGHDSALMDSHACTDARAVQASGADAPRTVVLDFGSQTLAAAGTASGVTQGGTSIAYTAVVAAVRAYVTAWHRCAPVSPPVTIAVGTNSDGNWDSYPAATRAEDWWDNVVHPAQADLPAGFTVAGASDIEPVFTASPDQLDTWITTYTGRADDPLIEFGTLDGCPPTPGQSEVWCSAVPVDGGPDYQQWTQEQAYFIAHGDAPGRIQVLPQITSAAAAAQWQNVDITGLLEHRDTVDFIGALTDHGAEPGVSLTPDQGWAYLYGQLSTDSELHQPLPTAADLAVL